ncbi:MAG: hypothetical protein WC971_06485 [Coriobacteriia bacterium]
MTPERYGDGIESRSSMGARSGAETILSPSRAVTPSTIHARLPEESTRSNSANVSSPSPRTTMSTAGFSESTSSATGPTSGPPSTVTISGRALRMIEHAA